MKSCAGCSTCHPELTLPEPDQPSGSVPRRGSVYGAAAMPTTCYQPIDPESMSLIAPWTARTGPLLAALGVGAVAVAYVAVLGEEAVDHKPPVPTVSTTAFAVG